MGRFGLPSSETRDGHWGRCGKTLLAWKELYQLSQTVFGTPNSTASGAYRHVSTQPKSPYSAGSSSSEVERSTLTPTAASLLRSVARLMPRMRAACVRLLPACMRTLTNRRRSVTARISASRSVVPA